MSYVASEGPKGRNGRMPALFIGHGSPMNIVLDNGFTRSLRDLGRTLPRPKAVLVVSAHWLTRGTFVSCASRPQQVYDFYGFPDALYEVQYPAPGSPADAESVVRRGAGFPVRCSRERGLDHAAWAVLTHMYPGADVPVLELSLDIFRPARDHHHFAKDLAQLRDEGMLIIGSGNIVHNLALMDPAMDAGPFAWALRFDEAVKDALLSGDHIRLVEYDRALPDALLAVPTNDHYLPLLYVAALQQPGERITFTHESIQHGSVSMRCFLIG